MAFFLKIYLQFFNLLFIQSVSNKMPETRWIPIFFFHKSCDKMKTLTTVGKKKTHKISPSYVKILFVFSYLVLSKFGLN